MTTQYTGILAGFILISASTGLLEAKEQPPPALPLEELAKRSNPTLGIAPPDLKRLSTEIQGAMIEGTPLYRALDELLTFVPDYSRPRVVDKSNSESTLRVCILARAVTSYYTSYQLTYGQHELRPDLKSITEKALLLALKQLEWIPKREKQVEDDYYRAYYSTLRRYLEVSQGWLLLNKKWTRVPVASEF